MASAKKPAGPADESTEPDQGGNLSSAVVEAAQLRAAAQAEPDPRTAGYLAALKAERHGLEQRDDQDARLAAIDVEIARVGG